MNLLSNETKQALKRKYTYQLVDMNTNEIVDSAKSRAAAERKQKTLFTCDKIICKVIEVYSK